MGDLTARTVCYLGSEEGLVLEAYLDNGTPPTWTWSMGVTAAAGVDVMQYKDKPASISVCLQAAIAKIRSAYLPAVVHAFAGHDLTESQIAGALSFQWRNGTIGKATWVKDFLAGNINTARHDFMNWTDHGNEIARAKREAALFFDGVWPTNLQIPIWSVAKPSYHPSRATASDLSAIVQSIIGGH